MKTLHLSMIIATAIMIIGIIFFVIILPSTQSQTTGNVEIQNIQVQPAMMRVGNTFTVSANLVNNLQNPVYVDFSPCNGPFVIVDSHVTVDVKVNTCEDVFIVKKVNSGEKIIRSGLDPTTATFRATTVGTTNATITFYYFEKDPLIDSVKSNSQKTISKSFSFTISNPSEQTSNSSQHLTTFDSKSLSPPILKIIAGSPVTTASEATTQVGYDVKVPTYIPAGYQVQIINADAHDKVITILVSLNTVSSQTTLSEFFNQQKGMLIYMEKNSPEFDEKTWFSNWVKDHNATIVSVNGIKGAVHGIVTGKGFSGETIESPAELVFVKNNISYEIRGIISIDELMKTAQTL
jgi:hypothetical protein